MGGGRVEIKGGGVEREGGEREREGGGEGRQKEGERQRRREGGLLNSFEHALSSSLYFLSFFLRWHKIHI